MENLRLKLVFNSKGRLRLQFLAKFEQILFCYNFKGVEMRDKG